MKQVVVYGTGSIGMRHLEVLSQMEGVSPIAMPVRTERLKDEALKQYHPIAVQSLEKLDPEAVVIATDTGRHKRDIETLRARLPHARLLVEKPLFSVQEKLNCTVEHIYVACNLRFQSAMQQFKVGLSGLGEVYSVRIECQSYLPDWRPNRDYKQSYSARKEEGGVMRDLVHEIDYAMWLFGRPQEVFAKLSTSRRIGIEAEESADLFWSVEDTSVSVRLDYLAKPTRRKMVAIGNKGSMEWDGTLQEPQGRNAMMQRQAEDFLSEKPTQLASYDDGLFAVRLMDAARLSHANKKVEVI